MNLPQRYPYNARWLPVFLSGLFFAFCAVVIGSLALRGSYVRIFDFLIGGWAARIILWTMCAFSVAGAGVSIISGVRRLTAPRILELGIYSLTLPRGLFQMHLAHIAYANIIAITEFRIAGEASLRIHTPAGKYAIAATLLQDNRTYEEIKQFLVSRAEGNVT